MNGSFWDGVDAQSVGGAPDRFAQFNIGENEAYIHQVNPTNSKSSGKKMLDIIFKKADGAEIHYYIVDDEYKLGKLKALQKTFNIPLGSNKINTEWTGKKGIVVCRESKPKDNGLTYPEVNYFKNSSDGSNKMNPRYMSPNSGYNSNHTQQGQIQNDSFDDDIPF